MLQYQDYYNNLIYGKNCIRLNSTNVSKSLKIINYDSRGIIQQNNEIFKIPLYHTTYKTDYVFDFPEDKTPRTLQRSLTDFNLVSNSRNKVMNSAIDNKAFRTWKIPESILTGNFPIIPINSKLSTTTIHTAEKTKSTELLSIKSASQINTAPSKPNNTQEKLSIVKESSVSQLLDSANLTERRIILKSLFLSDPQILKFSLRQALMPEAEKKIRTWLNTATSEEKSTSINFFKRLLKNENLSTDDKYFIQHILEIIKNEEDYWLARKPHPLFSSGTGETKLKFINLQSPESRRQRWMYTSWNHMPPYREEKTMALTGSHHYFPNKSQQSTYKIHPDLG